MNLNRHYLFSFVIPKHFLEFIFHALVYAELRRLMPVRVCLDELYGRVHQIEEILLIVLHISLDRRYLVRDLDVWGLDDYTANGVGCESRGRRFGL